MNEKTGPRAGFFYVDNVSLYLGFVEGDDDELVALGQRETHFRVDVRFFFTDKGDDYGAVPTGFPVAVAATMLADGTIKKAGAFPPEIAFEPESFIKALRARGFNIRKTAT